MQSQLFLIIAVVVGIFAMPSAIILIIGMLPTLIAYFCSTGQSKMLFVTVACMNVAGCTPLLLDVWTGDNTVQEAVALMSQPVSIVIAYSSAAMGYMIDWAMTGIVAGIMYKKGEMRIAAIEKRHAELITRWGEKVTGKIKLDSTGFPVNSDDDDIEATAKEASKQMMGTSMLDDEPQEKKEKEDKKKKNDDNEEDEEDES